MSTIKQSSSSRRVIRRRRSERGAVAVVFAICAVMLFGLAALGVDLGNAMNRKQRLQTNADFAALAGGGLLPAATTVPGATDPIVLKVAEYLLANHVYDDEPVAALSKTQLAQRLVSGLASDIADYGRVQYGYYAGGVFMPSKNYVTVSAPKTKVSFMLAPAIGQQGATVQARATVALKSKGSGSATLPFYAYTGCDWGQQVISHSTANATTLTFSEPTDNNGVVLAAGTLPNADPHNLDLNDTSTVVSLYGTGLTKATTPAVAGSPGITAVGFFLPDGTAPVTLPANQFLSGSTDSVIQFTLPPQVAADDGAVFYLRVQKWVNEKKGKNDNWVLRWSPAGLTMPYVEVGSATLFCNDDKSAGNFGSLSIFRMDSNSSESTGWLPRNIAVGLHEPHVKLNPYTAGLDSDTCDNHDADAKHSDDTSSGVLVNCVVTNVGFAQNAATNGFLTGVSGSPVVPGRLTSDDAISAGCGGANGAPELRTLDTMVINNEVLSCYFTNSTVTVADVSSKTYSGGVVLDPSIFGSPRFFSVPVINEQPANGKKSFPIVDFRYAFLTGENGSAFKGHAKIPSYYWDDSVTNGLQLAGNKAQNVKVEAFRVVFIHPKAVPPPPGGGIPQEFDGVEGQLYLID